MTPGRRALSLLRYPCSQNFVTSQTVKLCNGLKLGSLDVTLRFCLSNIVKIWQKKHLICKSASEEKYLIHNPRNPWDSIMVTLDITVFGLNVDEENIVNQDFLAR